MHVLVVTGNAQPRYVREIVKAGADGYILKNDVASISLPSAIRLVHEGGRYFSNQVVDMLTAQKEDPGVIFSPQETAILRLLMDGLDNEAIGRELNIAEKTVRNSLAEVYRKLGVSGRPDLNQRVAAVNAARRLGLLPEK